MGLAGEPIHGVATALFVLLTDIVSSDRHCSMLSDEWPVVAAIVGLLD